MGLGTHTEDNPATDHDVEAEKQKLNPNPEPEVEMKKIPVQSRDAEYPVTLIPGQDDPLFKVHHLKYMLLGFNFLVTILGVVLLSLSVWIYVDPEFWEYETTLKVDNLKTVLLMSIVVSLIILIIGFLGCFGAVVERRWILILYVVIFGLVFLLELVAIILVWSAPYSKTISGKLEKQILAQIKDRPEDDSSRKFMDFIQEHLSCCGSTGARDYGLSEPPNSCQSSESGSLYTAGCSSKLLSYIRVKSGIIGGIALPILLLQLLALIVTGNLIKRIETDSKYFM